MIRAPRGTDLTCRGWHQEAALRMLMNNLDPEVAERPEDLVVYGGTGKAARNWEAFWAIVSTLQGLDDDETLLVQSGKPVAVFRTHPWAPRRATRTTSSIERSSPVSVTIPVVWEERVKGRPPSVGNAYYSPTLDFWKGRCETGSPLTGGEPMTDTRKAPTIRAPRGTDLSCKGWHQEAALRMLMNNLDPEVAERPEDLVVYGGTGKAARDWESFWAIVSTLQRLDDDETLLVQSGKPVAVFRTHSRVPRVLISNSMLVPEWADWKTFRELERAGLTMYGQMTAGSWIYIGTQGILQGTYETFAALAEKSFGGTLEGRVCLTAGLGGMGGAQPLAITMNRGVALCVEVDERRIERRIEHRYLDERIDDLDAAVERAEEAKREGEP
ncbi:MAG: hypothetical protein ACRDTR_14450, partial [Rubrobacter sp.]